jgi:hypothetical protein
MKCYAIQVYLAFTLNAISQTQKKQLYMQAHIPNASLFLSVVGPMGLGESLSCMYRRQQHNHFTPN